MSGSWAYNVALVVFVFNVTHSPAWVAAASMTRFLTALVSSPLGGLVADRVERVRLMVSLDLFALTFQTGMAVVAALNGPIVLAIAFAALTSVSTASYDPAARAATPTIVGEEHLAAANSVQSAVENLSIIVGPAVGGLILLLGPPAIVFAVNAATFGFSAFVVSRMRARNRPADITEGGTTGPLQQMAAGIKAFAESSTVRLLAGFSILASFVYGTDTVLFVVVSKDQLGTGSTGYGYLLAALGVGGIVMAGFMKLVGADLLARFAGRVINTHPALLPSFPGMHGVRDALDHGVKVSGCTVFFVDAGTDSGPIIAQAAVPVHDDDNEATLHERIKVAERSLLADTVGRLVRYGWSIQGRKVRIGA